MRAAGEKKGTQFLPFSPPGVNSIVRAFSDILKSGFMRRLIVVIFTLSAVFWLVFSVFQFPWIVPADHNSSVVALAERSSQAGAWLFLLSLIAIWLPTGLYGRDRSLVVVTIVLLVGWLTVFPWLYPGLSVIEFPIRLGVYVVGFVSVVVGAVTSVGRRVSSLS